MEDRLCEAKHKRLDEKIEVQEKRINNHSERLDIIERVNSRLEERLDNLIKQLAVLNSTIKWFMGLLLGSFVAFFFYAVQQNIF